MVNSGYPGFVVEGTICDQDCLMYFCVFISATMAMRVCKDQGFNPLTVTGALKCPGKDLC